MSLTDPDGHPPDLPAVLHTLARDHGGTVSHLEQPACDCGRREFAVGVDERRASAAVECEVCGRRFATGQAENLADVCLCNCGGDVFEVGTPIVLSPGRRPRHLFLALGCVNCGLVAGYADWRLPPRARRPIWRPVGRRAGDPKSAGEG